MSDETEDDVQPKGDLARVFPDADLSPSEDAPPLSDVSGLFPDA